ncbi:PREDICTED: uncharacterized protein LOC106817274 [Priapulus caudatus]|uniref:Uncharacterized protein LOC106817274 n=1 Tax=Priapulus caudatus TaxID=37621 RepID=A0ABM1EYZ7_PRICU|nr:PREDICTED: uncharacterized protein LOC106817274 [Priapulus caudatus]
MEIPMCDFVLCFALLYVSGIQAILGSSSAHHRYGESFLLYLRHIDSANGAPLEVKYRGTRSGDAAATATTTDDDAASSRQQDLLADIWTYIERVQTNAAENCTRASLATQYGYEFPRQSYLRFESQATSAIKTANVLNNLFQTSTSVNLLRSDALYYAMVGSLIETDSTLYGAAIAFDQDVYPDKTRKLFCAYAYRQEDSSSGGGETKVEDLSLAYNYTDNSTVGNGWFREQKYKAHDPSRLLQKDRKYSGSGASNFRAVRGGVPLRLVTDVDGVWSSPYFDCGLSNRWTVTYSIPFYEWDGSDHFRFM